MDWKRGTCGFCTRWMPEQPENTAEHVGTRMDARTTREWRT